MTIDVHGHISPPEALARFPMPRSLGDVEGMIERKLALGVELTIVGSPVGAGAMVPLPAVDNYAQTEDELRRFHDWLAKTVADHPQHLRALVYANPFGGTRHLDAAADTLSGSEFVGFIVNTSVRGRYLDDPRAADFFALAAERDVPVVLHAPAQPAAAGGLSDPRLVEQLGRWSDVTLGVACCILGGWLERHPDLKLVATAGGGALSLLAERLDVIHAPQHWGAGGPPNQRQLPISRPPSDYLDRIWMDTASPSPRALAVNAAAFGTDRLMFGTDSPPLVGTVGPGLAAIDALDVPDSAKQAIRHGNAARLFGLAEPQEET